MMMPRVKQRQATKKRPGLDRSKVKPKLTFTQAPEGRLIPTNLNVNESAEIEVRADSTDLVNAPHEGFIEPNTFVNEQEIIEDSTEQQPADIQSSETSAQEDNNYEPEPIQPEPSRAAEQQSPVQETVLPEERFDMFQPLSSFIKETDSEDGKKKKEEAKTVNRHFSSDFVPDRPGFAHVGTPEEMSAKLDKVGYQCLPHLAVQISLLLNTPTDKIRALLLEGPSGCGKSYMAKSLAKITGAELMCLSCYKEMPMQNLIESPSTFAMASAMAGKNDDLSPEKLMNLGILAKAYLKSQTGPVILLVDELDKPDSAIDTFFLGPIQDSRIWLESRPPIDANPENLLIMFTKNFNRKLDEALLRRCHPILMTYLDSTLERKILSPHCHPQLVANLVSVADRMRNSGGAYAFERPPAPEELLTAGHYVTRLMEWGFSDPAYIGKSVWNIIAKSEHDRAVLEHMMRYHPDFMDPLVMDSKNAAVEEIHKRLGRVILNQIVVDPDEARREQAWLTLNEQ